MTVGIDTTTTYTYHPIDGVTLGAGMLHEVDGPFDNDTLAYSYDELGRVSGRTIDGVANQTSLVYDPWGRLEELTTSLGKFAYGYVGLTGRLDHMLYPTTNGQVTNFAYHGLTDDFRLQKIENLGPGQSPDPLSVFEYTYTPNGMIETWSQQAGTASPKTWTFGYDRAHQLGSAVLRNSSNVVEQSFGYGYDNAGNRTHERSAAGELDDSPGRGAIYNENNQLTGYSEDAALRFAGEIDQGGIVWVDGEQAEMGVDDSVTPPVQTFEQWLSLEPGTHQIDIVARNESGQESQKVTPRGSGLRA